MSKRSNLEENKLQEELETLKGIENESSKEINGENNDKKHQRRVKTAFLKMSLMAVLLIVSTYAWFTSQKDITLSNLTGTVEVAENMEISLDAKTWKQEIDLSNATLEFNTAQESRDKALGEDTDTTTRTTAVAVMPSQLLPVSGVGEKSLSLMPIYSGKATTISLTDIEKCEEIDGEKEAIDNGYFAFDIYIKNTSEDGADDVLQLNLNSAAQVLTESIRKTITDVNGNQTSREYIGDEASGLQNTIRVGLALYNGEVDSTSTQKEILEATRNATIQDIAIWEPNAKDHVEYIVTNNNKLVNGTDTDTDLSFNNGEEVTTYALNEDAVGTDITNVYDITTEGLGIQNTFKTDNTKDDATGEVTDYRIKSEDGKPLNITNIENVEFKIKSNKVSRLRVYVWLEGQDVDCINLASEGGGIELDLGLTKDNEVGDVLDETEESEVISEFTRTVSENGATYYGKKINYPVDIDIDGEGFLNANPDDSDWQIFYADGEHVYIIADDYVPNAMIPDAALTNLGMIRSEYSTTYSVYWDYSEGGTFDNNVKNGTYTIVDNKYMIRSASAFTNKNTENYQAVGSLLDTNIWTEIFANNSYAVDAIGGPTLEMWCESWNTVYDAENYEDEQIYCAPSEDGEGYLVGNTEPATERYIDMSNYTGYSNKMYFSEEGEDETYGYWLASSFDSGSYVMDVNHEGFVSSEGYDYNYVGVRPLVCLESGVEATYNGTEWEISGI